MTRNECLEILELPAGASPEDVVTAYKQLAQVWHPDRFPNNPELQQKANAKLATIVAAYHALRDQKFSREPSAGTNPPAKEWLYIGDGRRLGPVSSSKLRRMAEKGQLKPSDPVRRQGQTEWIRASSLAWLPFEASPRPTTQPDPPVASQPLRRSKRTQLPSYLAGGAVVLILVVCFLMFRPGATPENTEHLAERQPARIEPRDPKEIPADAGKITDANELQFQNREVERQQVDDAEPAVMVEEPKPAKDQQNAGTEPEVKNADAVEIIWQRFKHPKGVAEIEMPSKPVLNPDNCVFPPQPGVRRFSVRPPAEMNLDHPTTYTASVGDFSCSLQVSKLASVLVKLMAANPADYVKSVKLFGDLERDSLKDEPDINFVSDKPLWLGNARGREFQIESQQSVIVSRWYMTQTHQCRASMVLPKDRDTTGERERFFNSLALNGSSTAQNPQNATPSDRPKVAVVPNANDVDRQSHWKLFHATDLKPSRETSSSEFIGSEEFGVTATLTTDGRDILAIPHDGKWSAVAFEVSSRTKLASLYCSVNGIGLNFGDSIQPRTWTPVVVVYTPSTKKVACLVNEKIVSTGSVTSNKMSDQLLLKFAFKTPLNTTLEFRKLRVWTDTTPPAEIIELAAMNAVPGKDAEGKDDMAEGDNAIPEKIQEYLERAERIRIGRLDSLEKQVEQQKLDLLNVSPQGKAETRKQLTLLEKSRDELKAFRKPTAPLPLPMDVGDIGYHEVLFDVYIWDKSTIAARMYDRNVETHAGIFSFHLKPDAELGKGRNSRNVRYEAEREFIVTNVDTARLPPKSKSGGDWPAKLLLRVVAETPDAEVLMRFPEQQRERIKDHVVLEPMKNSSNVEKYRKLFYERKMVQDAK